jgi:hypothetical protein
MERGQSDFCGLGMITVGFRGVNLNNWPVEILCWSRLLGVNVRSMIIFCS